VRDVDGVRSLLRDALVAELSAGERELGQREGDGPTVWLVTGVNGAGKTTTIGKLAARETARVDRVVLAAADTFRAAAAEQLAIWAERTGAQLVRGDEGADPASVAYAGVEAALASDADLLIVDTAGRLQNRRELMDELGKVSRVLAKRAGGIDETLLVLDGTVGQNGIAQAAAFHEAVTITGVAITKLDGSSRGGIVVAVQRQLGIPVKLVGLGEGIDDLRTSTPPPTSTTCWPPETTRATGSLAVPRNARVHRCVAGSLARLSRSLVPSAWSPTCSMPCRSA
jgi:fused signal recognition particle receptor